MRAIIVLIAIIAVASAQYGDAPETPSNAPVCAVNKKDCDARSWKACGPKTTTSGVTCRKVFTDLCSSDKTFASAAACIQASCNTNTYGALKDAKRLAHCRDGENGAPGLSEICAERACATEAAPARNAPVCAVNKKDCDARSWKACGPKTTSTGHVCRSLFAKLCNSDKTFASAAACVSEQCDNLEKDEWHSANEHRDHCRNGDAGSPGLAGICAERACAEVAPRKDEVTIPVATQPQATVATQPPVTQPQATQPPVTQAPQPLVPCADDRVIFVATDDDCVDNLQDEVDKLQLVVEKLKLLLLVKGVPVPEKCDSPPVFPPRRDEKDDKKKDDKTTKNDTPKDGTKKDETPKDGNKKDDNKKDDKTTKNETPKDGTKKDETPKDGNKKDDNKKDDKTTKNETPKDGTKKDETPKDGNKKDDNKKDDKTTKNETPKDGTKTKTGETPKTGGDTPKDKSATTSSSSAGGISPAAVVGIVVGSAAAAGVAAVAIGLFAASSAAAAASPASAAGMPAASVNPLYQAATQGGNNPLHGP